MTNVHISEATPVGGASDQAGTEETLLGTQERPPAAAPSTVTTAGYAPAATAAGAPAGWWSLLKAVFSGDPARVTDAALRPTPTGSSHGTWIFAAGANGALVGLAVMVLMARVSSGLGFFFAPDAGDYLAAFVIPVVCAVALVLARAGAIVGLFATQKRTIAFRDAAALASIAFVVAAPFFAMLLLLSFIPGTFALVVLAFVGTFTAFYAEIALYVAVARVGRFATSPALPHAAISAVWLCVMSFLAGTIVTDAATDLLGALGGVL